MHKIEKLVKIFSQTDIYTYLGCIVLPTPCKLSMSSSRVRMQLTLC